MSDETSTVATSEDTVGTTDSPSDSVTENSSTAPSAEETKTSPSGDEDANLDLASIPQDLRPHVEKLARKYEKDFKSAYTKKFQDLSAKEKLWEQERSTFTSEREQWKNTAIEVLKDPKKLEAYRQLYNIPAPGDTDPAIPDNIQTIGDLLNWNKEQLQLQKESLRKELFKEAANIVRSTNDIQSWDSALKNVAKDNKHFSKYKDVIVQFANRDQELQLKYQQGLVTEEQVLRLTQEKLQAMQREDMEEIKAQTLAEQRKKLDATTTIPSKTLPTVQKAPKTKEEVIARVNARLGPASASH